MIWNGRFHFDKDWAAYRGASADNAQHAHAAIQLCFGIGARVALIDASGRTVTGDALYVKSCVRHQLVPIKHVLIVLVEPHSTRGRALGGGLPRDDFGLCPPAVAASVDINAPLAECLRNDEHAARSSPNGLDPRLANALTRLISNSTEKASLAAIAHEVGVSPSRLRHLAQTQLGLPLSKYVLWRKLGLASRALSRGESLAAAALAGGFSDQAHFTNSMRALIGLTPKEAQGPLS
jgi:AraC-like DNA-binding protein